jgi:ribonucleoside-diphosphate reductase alpha chain
MSSVNEIGRNVMQGGSRRSAIYASLNWQHEDIEMFLRAKDWTVLQRSLKEDDFSFPLPLDMSNISINWDTDFIERWMGKEYDDCDKIYYQDVPKLWYDSVLKMCSTGEPGHSYNFFSNENETLRNACSEFTSEDDSDV